MKNISTCSKNDCERNVFSRGLCQPHYRQALREGAPKRNRACKPVKQKLADKVEVASTGCLIWTGALNGSGYGLIGQNGRIVVAHRLAYEIAKGPIPGDMVVDHLCFNHACINVDHLRLATPKQNAENLKGARSDSTTGVRGVSRTSDGSRFRVRVYSSGKCYTRGPFDRLEDAESAAKELRAKIFTHSQN